MRVYIYKMARRAYQNFIIASIYVLFYNRELKVWKSKSYNTNENDKYAESAAT